MGGFSYILNIQQAVESLLAFKNDDTLLQESLAAIEQIKADATFASLSSAETGDGIERLVSILREGQRAQSATLNIGASTQALRRVRAYFAPGSMIYV